MSSVAQEPLLATSVTHVAGPSRPAEVDPFFKNSGDGILKTYTFEYDALTRFNQELSFSLLVAQAFVPPICPFVCCCGLPSYYLCGKQNIREAAHAQHLAITADGIKYVVDKHKSGCRFDCQVRERRESEYRDSPAPLCWRRSRLVLGAPAGQREGFKDRAIRQDDGL